MLCAHRSRVSITSCLGNRASSLTREIKEIINFVYDSAWLSAVCPVVSFSKYNHTDTYLVVIWLVFLHCTSHTFLIKSPSWRSTEINGETSLYLDWSMNSLWKENNVCITAVFKVMETIACLDSLQVYFFSWSLQDIFSVGTSLLVQTNLPSFFLIKMYFLSIPWYFLSHGYTPHVR